MKESQNSSVLSQTTRRFCADKSGQIAVIFALSSVMIMLAAGGGMDLSRAYLARQKLSEVATLACQYASRPSTVETSLASYSGSNGGATYVTAVTNFITSNLQTQNFILSQTNSSPFTYTQGGAANVTLSATVPTTFMQIANVTTIPITVTTHCYDTPAAVIERVPNGNSPTLIDESFEANVGDNLEYYLPNGTAKAYGTLGAISPSAFNNTVGYTGSNGTKWYITGYCLEQDKVGQIRSSVADGSYSVELDCDNGSNSAGNSSISTKVYLAAGNYELRYFYAARIHYPNYDPTYICGSAASDLSWANDTTVSGNSVSSPTLRTNQINVYLDLNTNGSPPTHTTIDGTQTLAGSNLIDMCLYGLSWLERSVAINVTTPGYYWLSFAADGASDSYGGQLDDIRLCQISCTGLVQDNFPSSWSAGTILFEDTFESPTYSGTNYNTNGNMYNSLGTSGASSGWQYQSSSGWALAPTNQLPYWNSGCPQATQCIELGWNANSLISRPFLLVPGYYQVSYRYVSSVTFSNLNSVYCGATPTVANISSLSANSTTGKDRVSGVNHSGTINNDTNTVGVFMSHAQMASTPNLNSTLGSTTTYTNPSGTTTTTPTVAPNGISLTSYNSSQVNPLLDICGYAATAQTRTVAIQITKPAYYWLTLSALGTSDAYGGQIDDVKLTVLGSPYMSSPPSGAVTIPVPNPQPGATVSYTNFSITADRFSP
jgi:Flp pilus assembly protein TadG